MKNIIIFSSIDWNDHTQIHQLLAEELSKKNYNVLFVDNTGLRSLQTKDFSRIIKRIKSYFKSIKGFRKIKDNITVYSPLIFPKPYSSFFTTVNSFLITNALSKWLDINKQLDT